MTQHVFTAGNYINYAYDNIGQLKTAQGFEQSGSSRLQEQFGYAYDKAWNLNERTNNALIQSFSVNSLNELSSASQSGTVTVAGTATEPSGNSPYNNNPGVTSVSINNESASVYGDGTFAQSGFATMDGPNTYTAIAHDNVGRYSTNSIVVNVSTGSAYTYDQNGNLTSDGKRAFIYDDENELIAVYTTNGWSNSFAYDGLQRQRIKQEYSWNTGSSSWQLTNETLFVYDGNLVVQERDQNDMTLTTYTRGNDLSGTLQGAGGIGGLLARSDRMQIIPDILSPSNPDPQWVNTAFYHSDGSGNVTALVQLSGLPVAMYQYDPYGNMLAIGGLLANENKYRYSSKEWNDNADLYYYGRRFYDPNLQRWINRDPIQELGGINLFAFIGNSPMNLIDPYGYCDPNDSADGAGGLAEVQSDNTVTNNDGLYISPSFANPWNSDYDNSFPGNFSLVNLFNGNRDQYIDSSLHTVEIKGTLALAANLTGDSTIAGASAAAGIGMTGLTVGATAIDLGNHALGSAINSALQNTDTLGPGEQSNGDGGMSYFDPSQCLQ